MLGITPHLQYEADRAGREGGESQQEQAAISANSDVSYSCIPEIPAQVILVYRPYGAKLAYGCQTDARCRYPPLR